MISKALGFVVLLSCLALVFLYEGSGAASGYFRILHWPAILLTGAGPMGLILICSDWASIRQAFKHVFSRPNLHGKTQTARESALLHRMSQEFYAQGPRAFDSRREALSPQLTRTIRRLSMRTSFEDAREMLAQDDDRADAQISESIGILGLGVRLSPSIGMLGTILGMVQLLSSMTDPSHIGSHMSLALLTTFYGLFFSLMLWTPLQRKLEAERDAQSRVYARIERWLDLLERRKPPQYLIEEPEHSGEKRLGRKSH